MLNNYQKYHMEMDFKIESFKSVNELLRVTR